MNEFKGYKAEMTSGNVADRLPVGNYKIRIIGAEEAKYSWGSVLLIKFDIDDGEWKNYYTNRYNNRTNRDEKYKGIFRLTVPSGDGSDKDSWNVKRFNNAMGCLERDNPKFKWKWDESKLRGLKCGMVFRNKEWEYNGKRGFYTEPYNLASLSVIDMIRTPSPKTLPKTDRVAVADPAISFDPVDTTDGDLPF